MLLSIYSQRLLIYFYGANSFTKAQAIKICGSERTFYRTMRYLLDNQFVKKYDKNGYSLTAVKGIVMADILCSLNDNPYITREKAFFK